MTWSEYFSQHKRIVIAAAVAAGHVFVATLFVGALGVEAYFANRVYPNVRYAELDLGMLTRAEAATTLETWQDQWWRQEMKYTAYDETGKVLSTVTFYPVIVAEGSSQSYELVWYDIESMLDRAFAVGRTANGRPLSRALRGVSLLAAAMKENVLTPSVDLDEARLEQVLRLKLEAYETQPRDASLAWRFASQRPSVVSEESGNTFDYARAIHDTETVLLGMRNSSVNLYRAKRVPQVTTEDVTKALETLADYQTRFPVAITYRDELYKVNRSYDLPWGTAFQAVQVAVSQVSGPELVLQEDQLDSFFDAVEREVNVEAQNAKFEIAAGQKVQQFEPSRTGYALNRAKTVEVLNSALSAPRLEVTVASLQVDTIEPEVTTDGINDLGIKEVLGVGYSNFKGSPRNRVHNISVGVNRLNGTLIAPGEDFSLLNALKPFTATAGYLPELVIKGDKIEPEIGGGLCQIGSTTFRAAMNSGLPIVERRNHSLVVSYYNDPRNGNPGTDATIYDPSPDFKFTNDTGNYILIVTSMNNATGDLNFTFWGTNDGRKGEYSEPVVSRWIPAGEEKLIESPDLKPGEKKCQAGHIGAVASFVYTVNKPGQEAQSTTYTSNYRPLPRICLVGVSAEIPTDPNNPEADNVGVTEDGQPIAF